MFCIYNTILLLFVKIFIGDVMNIERLKEIREDKDLKQSEVANAIGIKQQQYSEY